MNKPEILVFDIGGTTIRSGVFEIEKKQLTRVERAATPSFYTLPDTPFERLRPMLYEVMRSLAERLGARSPWLVSVGFPGPVDENGVALRAPTLWGTDQRSENVAAKLQDVWPSARIIVANDLSAAGFCFLDSEYEDVCIVTVSSGIGHKVFVGGRPIVGAGGRGGELGHLRVDFSANAPQCDCGGKGHLGAIASGRAILGQAKRFANCNPKAFSQSSLAAVVGQDPSRLENQLIARAFRAGDPWTSHLIGKAAEPLGRALAGIHAAVGVERFVIMGGVAHALGHKYLKLIGRAAAASEWALGQDWEAMLELGTMGDDAGLIGAGRLALRAMKGPRGTIY